MWGGVLLPSQGEMAGVYVRKDCCSCGVLSLAINSKEM